MKRPNILFVLTDQQRADTIASSGNPIIKTPTFDRLAREGVAFTRAYTPCPVCSPARGSLACGVPPHLGRQTDNVLGGRNDLPGFAELLRDAGYQTHGFGKLHYLDRRRFLEGYEGFGASATWESRGDVESHQQYMTKLGLPEHVLMPRGLACEHYYLPQHAAVGPEHHHDWWVADRACDFLRQRDRQRPFLLSVHFDDPHPPFRAFEPWVHLYRALEMKAPLWPANYRDYHSRTNRMQNRFKWIDRSIGDDLRWRATRACYYGMISYIDWLTGRILETLGDEIDNTLIIFSTDHGEMMGDYGCAGKRCMLEASVRIPLLARWPQGFAAGQRVAMPATLLDIFPTVAQAAGLHVAPPSTESRSLLDIAGGAESGRLACSQFSQSWCGQYYATDGRYAYIWSTPDQREWLFKIGDGLEQGPDLARDAAVAPILNTLRGALLARHGDDVFSDAVENGGWKRHIPPPTRMDSEIDYGLLMQEPAKDIQAAVDALGPGYARKITGINDTHALMMEHYIQPRQ